MFEIWSVGYTRPEANEIASGLIILRGEASKNDLVGKCLVSCDLTSSPREEDNYCIGQFYVQFVIYTNELVIQQSASEFESGYLK